MSKKGKMAAIQIATLCFLFFFLSLSQAEVTLTVGKGSGNPGSSDNILEISLLNPEHRIKAVQVDICEEGVNEYLTCTGCETTSRTDGFTCITVQKDTNCCGVVLSYYNGLPFIEVGQGVIFSLEYDISSEAQGCGTLNPVGVKIADEYTTPIPSSDIVLESGGFCFPCTDDGDCDDGLFCSGDESCVSGQCIHSGDPCPPDTVCDEETDSCITTTTTTISTTTTSITSTSTVPDTTTSIPDISTTTTTIDGPIPSCKVFIAPLSATIGSGTALQFSARTECEGDEVEGNYNWQIVSESTIGSSIDAEGLFTAGDNTTDSPVDETVRVTDTAHGNKSAIASVTIQKKQDPVGCEVAITPSSATVSPGDTLTLRASVIGECTTPLYEWELDTETESMYEPEGDTCNYTAGPNDGTDPLTDIMTVRDTVNGIETDAEITIQVEGVSIEISPENLWKSRLIPLPYLLFIKGEGTHFKAFVTSLSFEPPEAVYRFWPLVLGKSSIWDIILVMPSWLAGEEDQTVNVTVETGNEIVSDDFLIKLPSLPGSR